MKTYIKPLAAICAATLLAACGSDDSSNPTPNSYLRVFHAAADAPMVNVWLDGEPALTNVDYQQTSGSIMVPAGEHTVQIDAILPDNSVLTVLPATTLDLMADTEYNVLATGKAAKIGSGDADEFGPQIVARDNLTPEGARVQAMHASPDVPMVDVFITAPGADLNASMPFADNVEYPMATDAVEVPAGDYQIRITDPNDSSMVFFDSGSINVPAGSDWFAAAVPNTMGGSAPVNLLVDTGEGTVVVADESAEFSLRVGHTISDAPGVDIWVNGSAPDASSPLFNLMYTEITDYLNLDSSASYDFAVGVNGSDPVVVVDALGVTGAMFEAGKQYTALAIGNLGDMMDNDETYVVMDMPRRVATAAKLRAIHASTIAGNVDIYLSADATPSADDVIIADVPYKGDTGTLSVSPGTAYVIVTLAGDAGAVAIGPAELPLAGGTLTTLVAIDDGMGGATVMSIDD